MKKTQIIFNFRKTRITCFFLPSKQLLEKLRKRFAKQKERIDTVFAKPV
jgi:hypothetical protein